MARYGRTHGESRGESQTSEWRTWKAMIERCYNPHNIGYENYGGRGIKVFKEWKDDFSKFLAFMGRKPNSSDTIERIYNNLGYFPGNVKWATKREQAQNRNNSLRILYKGEWKVLREWARVLGFDYDTVHNRIRKWKWDIEKAFETPTTPPLIEYQGKKQTLIEWAKELNILVDTLRKRLRNGWTIERAFQKEIKHNASLDIVENN